LRVALLTIVEPAGAGAPVLRGLLRIGGASVARHQVALALAMECRRVVCLTRSSDAEIALLARAAEAGGANFRIIATPAALAGEVTGNDELVVIADGLLALPAAARSLLDSEHAVLVQPADSGIPAGFERIDLSNAAGGVMRLPGRLVERLVELPADVDAASALTRIALQAGVPMRPVPGVARQDGGWTLVRDESEAHAAETIWVGRLVAGTGAPTPGFILARAAAARLGPAMLHAGYGSRSLGIAALALLAMALGLGWNELIAGGFVVAACAWTLGVCAGVLERIERETSVAAPPMAVDRAIGWTCDVVLVILSVWREAIPVWDTWHNRAFAPVMALGLLRLLPRALPQRALAWCEDRLALGLGLSLAAALGLLAPAIQGLALALVLLGLLLSGARAANATLTSDG
jgi:hypothetical protein